MQTMVRESWTDERLNEFGKRMDERFDRVDERFAQVEDRIGEVEAKVEKRLKEVDARFDKLDARFDKVDARFESLQREMNLRFEGIHRSLVHAVFGICGVMVTGFVGVIAAPI